MRGCKNKKHRLRELRQIERDIDRHLSKRAAAIAADTVLVKRGTGYFGRWQTAWEFFGEERCHRLCTVIQMLNDGRALVADLSGAVTPVVRIIDRAVLAHAQRYPPRDRVDHWKQASKVRHKLEKLRGVARS